MDAVTTNGVSYLTSDHLGSTRLVTDINGYERARHDYLPFGEELPSNVGSRSSVTGYGAVDGVRQKFTQKQRDSESGLDYFEARYYSSAQGRFTSPDEFTGGPHDLYNFLDDGSVNPTLYADVHNPQSLNKYQYCYNNPLIYVDPDGHQTILDKALDFGAQTVADTINGGLKTGYNAVISGPNTVNTIINGGLSLTSIKFRFQTFDYAKAETPGEKGSMLASDMVLIYLAAKAMTPVEFAESPRPAAAGAEARTPATQPYKRPSGATTAEQRASVQGQPCVECGKTAPKMVANHKTPLVQEHYQTGAIDTHRMRQVSAVNSHCPTCSAREGARMSRYSRAMKRKLPVQH